MKLSFRALAGLAFTAVIVILYHAFPVKSIIVISGSMEPTILKGDRIIMLPFKEGRLKTIQRGDIISIKPPEGHGLDLVKRVVALGGDRVVVDHKGLFVNKKRVQEPYVKEKNIVYTYGPFVVPPGTVFVLGDNRNMSDDSSVWGPVPEENILGKILFMYYPWEHFGTDLKMPSAKKI